MSELASKKRLALEVISEACERYACTKVFALFSGGDDSRAALLVAREHPNFIAAVHCNTGIGVEATREYVRETCRQLNCPLLEYKAAENARADGYPDPQIYEELVLEHGFPGPTRFGHGKMYNRLKDRGIRRLVREFSAPGEKIVLASGCRQDESTRRMGTSKRIALEKGESRRVWVNHIFDWTHREALQLGDESGTARNPVSELIGKSGECLCGAYAKEGELEELLQHDLTRPVGLYLLDLERRVLAAGFPWRWHEAVPSWWLETNEGQLFLFDMNKHGQPGPMCQKCEAKALWGS